MTKGIVSFRVVLILIFSIFFVDKYLDRVIIQYDIKILEPSTKTSGQLYYKSTGNYSESKVKPIEYNNQRGTFQRTTIALHDNPNIISLRLDPLISSGHVEIKNLTVSTPLKSFKIDLREVTTKSESNHVKILEQSKSTISLNCYGDDPFLIIVNNLFLQKSKIVKFSMIMLLSIIVFFFLKVLSSAFLLFSILTVYTVYALLFSTWDMAENLLLTFMFISLYVSLENIDLKIRYIKEIFVFLCVYIGLSYSGLFIETPLFNLDYLNEKSIFIFAVFLIPLSFYHIKEFDYYKFKTFLTLLVIVFASIIIMLNLQVITINGQYVFDIMLHRGQWTQKNYTFWYLILMFATLSFYSINNKKDILLIIFIVAISFYAVFNAYSYSARVAFIIGMLVYVILLFVQVKKSYLLIFIWLLTLYIIFSPIILGLIDLSQYHPRLVARDAIFNTASSLIREHWFFGYGFGSTLNVNIHDFVQVENLPVHFYDMFPGGHPHNLSLLFWLEFGLIGAFMLAYFLHRLFLLFVEATYNKINQPALFGMIICFEVITSFSWSIWYPQVLLTFTFFGLMLVLSMNVKVGR